MTISFLSLVIAFKISVSLVLLVFPFLLASQERLERLTGTTAASPLFFRLYGVAISALLVGYAFAFPTLQAGQFPWSVAIMGAISNGGGSYLVLKGRTSRASRVQGYLFGGIFLALMVSMVLPDLATRRIL